MDNSIVPNRLRSGLLIQLFVGQQCLKSFLKIGAAAAISFLGGQIIAGKIWVSLDIKASSAVTFYGIGQKFGGSLGEGRAMLISGVWSDLKKRRILLVDHQNDHNQQKRIRHDRFYP